MEVTFLSDPFSKGHEFKKKNNTQRVSDGRTWIWLAQDCQVIFLFDGIFQLTPPPFFLKVTSDDQAWITWRKIPADFQTNVCFKKSPHYSKQLMSYMPLLPQAHLPPPKNTPRN